MVNNVYVDTQYVYAHVIDGRKELDLFAKREFRDLTSTTHNNILTILPFVVLGETINSIKRKDLPRSLEEQIMAGILNLSRSVNIDFRPACFRSIKVADYIKTQDIRLDDTDILIVSQALCDPDATLLLFLDEKIITSDVIEKLRTNRPNSLIDLCGLPNDYNTYKNLDIRESFRG